jgi:hypothetical protein
MKQDNRLLIEYASDDWDNFHKYLYEHYDLKNSMLKRRAKKLNEFFEFTEENIRRLDEFARIVAEKEKWAYEKAKIQDSLFYVAMLQENSLISDYEIEVEMQLYSDKLLDGDEELGGTPFYRHQIHVYKRKNNSEAEILEHEDWLFKENHNEFGHFGTPHPLEHQFHCYTIHQLYTDCNTLAWQDILSTDLIFFDIIINVQNALEIKNNFREFNDRKYNE